MKTNTTSDSAARQLVEYINSTSNHRGYHWDGIYIAPGTTVVTLKTIAAETGLSYYRVRKRLTALAEAGVLIITRHKGFAIITLNPTDYPTDIPGHEPTSEPKPTATKPHTARPKDIRRPVLTPFTMPIEQIQRQPLNRAQRRRLAREAARRKPFPL